MSTPTPQTPLADLRAEEPQNDHIELIRHELADTARKCGMRCAEWMIHRTTAKTHEEWFRISDDFLAMSRRLTTSAHATYPAHKAAECVASEDVDGALKVLADSCGISVQEWVIATRAEMS